MEGLPFVVLEKIFSEMNNLNEIVRCSLVCRNWRAAYKAYKPETLCLHHDNFLALNHRLFHSTEKLTRWNFFKTSANLQFLHSEITKTHFENIKKLIVFEFYEFSFDLHYHCKLSFQNQLNYFRSLEYLEIRGRKMTLDDNELELPKLKTLCFEACKIEGDTIQIILNTPSLESLTVFELDYPSDQLSELSDFKFLFPHQLKYLEFQYNGSVRKKFKLKEKFEKLECLVLRSNWDSDLEQRLIKNRELHGPFVLETQTISDNFLSSFPSLKFLFSFLLTSADEENLEEQKRKLNLNNLIFLDFDYCQELDCGNWQKYASRREQFRFYPGGLGASFSKLVRCQIPFDYFKEDYLNLVELQVGHVVDQSALVDLLKSTRLLYIDFKHDLNLEQEFFDEIACFLTVQRVSFFESTLNRLSDLSVLTKFNFREISLRFERLPLAVISILLKKPSCYDLTFQRYSGWIEDPLENGELQPDETYGHYHHLVKRVNDFYCTTCLLIGKSDPTFSDAFIETVARHIDNPMIENYRERTTFKQWFLDKIHRLFAA